MSKTINVEISTKTILQIVGLLISIYLGLLITDIILLIFIAILLSSALNPLVRKLEDMGIPKGISIAMLYFGMILVGGTILMLFIPSVAKQVINLFEYLNLSDIFLVNNFKFNEYLHISNISSIVNQARTVPSILAPITSIFSFLIYTTTLAVMTFYLLIERHNLHKHLHFLFRNNQSEKKAQQFIDQLEIKIGSWVRGEVALMIIVGVMTYVGLILLQIPYALPLAILAGSLEVLPNLGPTLSAIPAFLIAVLTGSIPISIGVLALYLVVQQLENNFIVPMVMNRSVGINPIVTIVILLVGFRLGGVIGGILAIPIYIVIKATTTEYKKTKPILTNKLISQ